MREIPRVTRMFWGFSGGTRVEGSKEKNENLYVNVP